MAGKFNLDALKGPGKAPSVMDKFKNTGDILDKAERLVDKIPADRLLAYKGHPKVRDTPKLHELADSIQAHGILTPLQVRLHPERRGYYEILAGHHRYAGGEMSALPEYPCIITDADDDTAALIVAESNKQNGFDDMLPSEIAWAIGIEYEALKHQGKRNDLLAQFENEEKSATDADEYGACGTSFPMDKKLYSSDEVGEKNNISASSISRYIRLNKLICPLLDMVDNAFLKQKPAIPFRAGVDISYLSEAEQGMLLEQLETAGYTVDMKKSAKFKEDAQAGRLTADRMKLILSGAIFDKPVKKVTAIKLLVKRIRAYIPPSVSSDMYEQYIMEALEYFQGHESEI